MLWAQWEMQIALSVSTIPPNAGYYHTESLDEKI